MKQASNTRSSASRKQLKQAFGEAVGLYQAGQPANAAQLAQRILTHDRQHADALHLLGVIAIDSGNYQQGTELVGQAIALRASNGAYHNSMGNALSHQQQYPQAAEHYRKAFRLDSRIYNALFNLGKVLLADGKIDEAISCLRRATAKRPDDAAAYSELARGLQSALRHGEAIEPLRKALDLIPDFPQARNNLAVILQHEGDYDGAVLQFEEALKRLPDDPEVHANYGQLLLQLGQFERGWAEYDWRHKGDKHPALSSPEEPFSGQRVILYSEQGVGDELMFASCLPQVMAQAAHCEFNCDDRLTALLQRSFPGIDAHMGIRNAHGQWEYEPRHGEIHLVSGSLPRYLRRQLTNFPDTNGYLKADADAVERWHSRFASLDGELTVGISWRGGGTDEARRERSIALEQWLPLLSVPGVRVIDLQYGDWRAEATEFEAAHDIRIHHWDDADPLSDLDGFAAQIAALDLVISVDNTTVHMAGGLGKPVWTLLPTTSDWRWMLDRDDTPWYPSMRLFRQQQAGDWGPVIQQLVSELTARVKQQPRG